MGETGPLRTFLILKSFVSFESLVHGAAEPDFWARPELLGSGSPCWCVSGCGLLSGGQGPDGGESTALLFLPVSCPNWGAVETVFGTSERTELHPALLSCHGCCLLVSCFCALLLRASRPWNPRRRETPWACRRESARPALLSPKN